MSRFDYKVVIKDIGTKLGFQDMKPTAVTIHHTAVETNINYDVIARLKGYAKYHNGVMPYHIYIPYKNDNTIYVSQALNKATIHNSNWYGNRACIAICLEGNFQVQQPLEKQLQKLKQVLDDIQDNRFSKDKWVAFDTLINPKDPAVVNNFGGVKVPDLHWHNEVAQPGNNTACCGKNLIPKVKEYRDKKGNVNWGTAKPPILTCEQKLKIAQQEIINKNVKLTELGKTITAKNTRILALEKHTKSLESRNKALEKTVANKVVEIEVLNKKLEDAQKANKRLSDSNSHLNDDIKKLGDDNKVLTDQLNKKIQELDECGKLANKHVETLTKELEMCIKKRKKLEETIKNQGIKLVEKNKTINTLESQLKHCRDFGSKPIYIQLIEKIINIFKNK